jgi:beta-phosphoglucomutase-like phosphatase (HAD superfamily)
MPPHAPVLLGRGAGAPAVPGAAKTALNGRARKPDPSIFDFAMRTIDRRAAEVVMVGNSEVNDIEPAVKLGLRSIRVAIDEPPPWRTCANVLATSLFDVAQQLERWRSDPRRLDYDPDWSARAPRPSPPAACHTRRLARSDG